MLIFIYVMKLFYNICRWNTKTFWWKGKFE